MRGPASHFWFPSALRATGCPSVAGSQRSTCYNYDAAGNLIQNGSTQYTYDAENRLTALSTPLWYYVYDGDGNRVEKCTATPCPASGTGTVYWRNLAGDPISESGLNGTMLHEYIFFNGKRAARRDISGNVVSYYFSDHLGSTDVVTSATGTITKEADYYPYGGEIPITGSDINNYKFTGKERDTESGLDNFGARYNASTMGRFMTPDPGNLSAIFHMNDPQSWNGYAYARNNPLKYTDPSGLDYTICDSDGKNCSHMDDKTFDSERNKDKGELFQNGSMFHFDQDGNKVMDGTYQWNGPDIPGDPAANLAAMGMIGNGGTAIVGAFAESMVYTAAGGVVVGEVVEGIQAAAQVAKLSMVKPLVSNPQLAAIVEKLFQATDVLEGGTAGAVRYEGITGKLLSNAGHAQKAEQAITEITNVLKSGTLSYRDQQVARELIGDLTRALSGK
jgi:RHS repeat-associated protein